jgi:hypothetical protein
MSDKPRVFAVTRTKDNNQLGLSVLIDSLSPGETKEFVEAEPVLERIKELEAEVSELKQKLEKAVETLKFYADRNNWRCWDTDFKDMITLSDISAKNYTKNNEYAVSSGGNRARQTLKDLGIE